MKRILFLSLLFLVILPNGSTSAHAAALSLTGGSLHAFTQSRCTNATVTVEPSKSGEKNTSIVRVTGIPVRVCAGRAIIVTVYDANSKSTKVFARETAIESDEGQVLLSSDSKTHFQHDLIILVTIGGWPITSNN